MHIKLGCLSLTLLDNGIGHVVFDRPPVNAVSISVYEDIGKLVEFVELTEGIRVLVLSAPENSKAWCGGADLNDFVGMDPERRKSRYDFINARIPGFARMDRPVIAAINGHAIGIGMILAAICDLRVAAEDAMFACPEIDYGLIAGGAGIFAMLKMPEAKIREMLFTGNRFSAKELEPTGFFNYVVPRSQVISRALELATNIASKSLPVVRARKLASVAIEGRSWMEAYLDAQVLSGQLAGNADGEEGVLAFIEHRQPNYKDE
jgi:enoyl-CoA hydratase